MATLTVVDSDLTEYEVASLVFGAGFTVDFNAPSGVDSSNVVRVKCTKPISIGWYPVAHGRWGIVELLLT